ncbi:MAG: PQQ-binding-like beta-propeller repeat protein [Mariniblastus sp.]|nr:PQQ-binding-like beta-propeller repeat protein [Mariniblastus sp.]
MKHGLAVLICGFLLVDCTAQSWPTFRGDNARSGNSRASLDCAKMELAWIWRSPLPPDPAWDGPARWDAYNLIRDLPAMRGYDACFHPVSDGEMLFFGSSSQDSLIALDLVTGESRWTFIADGPIRLSPTVTDNRVYFGCDDGFAYCLDKASGTLEWKFSPSAAQHAEPRKIINNDRLISCYPVRTGVTLRDGLAYFAASFMPWRESYICAVDARTGKLESDLPTFLTQHQNATLEGSLLVAENRLIVPQGRIAPLVFDRTSGKNLGSLPGGGGVTIVLTPAGEVVRTEGGGAARNGQIGVFEGKERVASFPRGRSLVVDPDHFFVIDGEKLLAAKRSGNELQWQRNVDEPLELIRSGNQLIVGGRDHVTTVDADSGEVIWSAAIEGRGFGLAVAGNHLVVSTDEGNVYAFSDTADSPWQPQPSPKNKTWQSPPVSPVRQKNLLHRWVFHRSGMSTISGLPVTTTQLSGMTIKDQEGSADATLSGDGVAIQIGESDEVEGIELQGGYFPLASEVSQSLPNESISVEAWVRVDKPLKWGGVAGCIQDDGSTEHGWLLGFRDDKFCFAMAGSQSGLTYLTSPNPFQLQSWNHLVGTYNGRETRLYVNGSLVASTQAEQGPISYSAKCLFTIGAYKDVNESYPLEGALQELRIYSTALDGPSVQRMFAASASEFPAPPAPEKKSDSQFVTWGPVANYIRAGSVEIQYGTVTECPTIVEIIGDDFVRRITGPKGVSTRHRIVVSDLPYRREIQYQLKDSDSVDARTTLSFSLDTHFDWLRGSHGKPDSQVAAINSLAANPRGLAIVVGASMAERAMELAAGSQFNVVLITANDSETDQVRKQWQAKITSRSQQLFYGKQLSAMALPLKQLPAAFATVVMAEENTPDIRRLVRPSGGILHDGNQVAWKRQPLSGSGDWSHMYGQSDNSAFGGETLSDASTRQDLATQWIGRPGPRYQTDRQNRKPSPLAVGGRLFLQGQQRMIALDSFSGSILWSVESPTVMRWNVPHDCSNWCADEEAVYVAAENQAWKMDGRNGKILKQFSLPLAASKKAKRSWGYIARHDNLLVGTAVDRSAAYMDWWGSKNWFDSTGGPDTHVVAGDLLFAIASETGKAIWQYEGLVLHPTITIMDDRIYFIQDMTQANQNAATRRISIEAGQSHELVCLDVATGQKQWAQQLKPFVGHIASLYLAGGGQPDQRSLIIAASEATLSQFSVRSFDPISGQRNWVRTVDWETNHHGKHISRPAIQGELVYLRPEVLNLATGETVTRGFPSGHGCSSYSLSTQGMFSRLGETTWWDVRNEKVHRFDRIRTDCWISVVPAQGMLLAAEGGGGCSCGSWLETSMGFLPRTVSEDLPEK